MNKVNQRLMRLAAERQAEERAGREGTPMYIYHREESNGDVTWYVRSESEGKPENAIQYLMVTP